MNIWKIIIIKFYTNIIKKLSADVPFVGPETQERNLGKKFKARLGANESVFGPSEIVINAMKTCIAKDIWKLDNKLDQLLKSI